MPLLSQAQVLIDQSGCKTMFKHGRQYQTLYANSLQKLYNTVIQSIPKTPFHSSATAAPTLLNSTSPPLIELHQMALVQGRHTQIYGDKGSCKPLGRHHLSGYHFPALNDPDLRPIYSFWNKLCRSSLDLQKWFLGRQC